MLPFSYTIRRHARSRRLRLTVHQDGRVVVTAPNFFPELMIAPYVERHAAWIQEKLAKFAATQQQVRIKRGRKDFLQYKEAARVLITKRLAYFNQFYGYAIGRVSIRDQRTRWGSCSKRGNLSFNYRLALLPAELADYVIVHELCHIGALNHSKLFWDAVKRVLPDMQQRRRALKELGLHGV